MIKQSNKYLNKWDIWEGVIRVKVAVSRWQTSLLAHLLKQCLSTAVSRVQSLVWVWWMAKVGEPDCLYVLDTYREFPPRRSIQIKCISACCAYHVGHYASVTCMYAHQKAEKRWWIKFTSSKALDPRNVHTKYEHETLYKLIVVR